MTIKTKEIKKALGDLASVKIGRDLERLVKQKYLAGVGGERDECNDKIIEYQLVYKKSTGEYYKFK